MHSRRAAGVFGVVRWYNWRLVRGHGGEPTSCQAVSGTCYGMWRAPLPFDRRPAAGLAR